MNDAKRIDEVKENSKYIGKKVNVVIDRQLGTKHPKHGFEYPVNYGYIPDTMSADGEELDVYVLGVDEPIETFSGTVIAMIRRFDDNEDKFIVTDNKEFNDDEIREMTNFQEQWFKSEIIRKPIID